MEIEKKLQYYQDRLEEYFRSKSEDSRCFLLDHDLEDDEYLDMLNALKDEFKNKGMMREKFYLPYLLVLSELGFQFSGRMYWELPKKEFPHESYWDNYNNNGGREQSLDFFRKFESNFEAVIPIGEWAENKRYISHPVTHAILPYDLQEKLFDFISEELDAAEHSEFFTTPEKLGQVIQGTHQQEQSTHGEKKLTRFDNLIANPTLLGTLVFHISDSSPTTMEGAKQLIKLSPRVRSKITAHLSDHQKQIISRTVKRNLHKRRPLTATAGLNNRSQRTNKKEGFNFRPYLEIDRDGIWELYLQLPQINVIDSNRKRLVDNNSLRIMNRGDSSTRTIMKGGLQYPLPPVLIQKLAANDEPLIKFKNQDSQNIYENFFVRNIFGERKDKEPWVFKLSSDGGKAKLLKGLFIQSGSSYLVALRNNESFQELPSFVTPEDINTENLYLYRIDIPTALIAETIEVLKVLGLVVSSHLIEIHPLGLSKIQESEAFHLPRSQFYIFSLRVNDSLSSLSIRVHDPTDEDTNHCSELKIKEQGNNLVMIEPSKDHIGDQIFIDIEATYDGNIYKETKYIDIFEPKKWEPGITSEVPFTIRFLDEESNDEFIPSLEELVENDFDLKVTLPYQNIGAWLQIELFDDTSLLGETKPIPFKENILTKPNWDSLVARELNKLYAEIGNKAYEARLTIDANKFGKKIISFPSETRPDAYFTEKDGQLVLVDEREDDSEGEYDIYKYTKFSSLTSDKHGLIDDFDSHSANAGIYSIGNSDIIFKGSNVIEDIDIIIDSNCSFERLISCYRKLYYSRAASKDTRILKRRALLEINRMMINILTDNKDWLEAEKIFFKSGDIENLEWALKKFYRTKLRMSFDKARDELEELKAFAESVKKQEIRITKSDKSRITSSELEDIRLSVQNKEVLIPEDLGYIDEEIQDTLSWFGIDINHQSLMELEKEIKFIQATTNLALQHEVKFVQEWNPEALLTDLIENPSDYGINNFRGMYIYKDRLKIILDILVRPGNLINHDSDLINDRFLDRVQIDFLSSNHELILNLRFMTLINSKLRTERVKPLFRQWEPS